MSRRNPGEGTVYQRKDGRWEGTIQINGTRKTVYGKSEREAKRKLQEVQKNVATSGRLPTCGKKTLSDLLDFWLSSVDLKPRTIADYERVCILYIKPHLGNMKLSALEPNHLQWLYSDLQTRGLKRMPYYAHQALHRALRLAVMWGWLANNPADRVLPPKYKPARKDVWTSEELTAFLSGTEQHWLRPLWLTTIATGCRLGELTGLRWQDIDTTAGTLTICRNLQRINKQWVEGTPKTKSGERIILLPTEGITALRKQKAQQAQWKLKASIEWQGSGLVFSGQSGQPLCHAVVEHALKRECERLALPTVTPHGLRHLHASLLLSKGLPITSVSARLGHATPAITMQVYAHALKSQDQEAANAIGAVLSR